MSTAAASKSMNGPRKAAILMATLGEEAASALLRQLSEEDVQRVAEELANLGNIPVDQSLKILEEYYELAVTQEYVATGGHRYAATLLKKAFGEDTARKLLTKFANAQEAGARGGAALQKADPQQLAKFLEGEHPQTVALVLGHLKGNQASSVVKKLPEAVRGEAVRRLANLQQFSPDMTEAIFELMGRRMQSTGETRSQAYDGFKTVAEMLNTLDGATADEILKNIEREDPQLAIDIRNQMFTFEDFLQVPEQGLRELMGQVDRKLLTMALKLASEELREHLFKTMSSRAVAMLKEDMEALGPVRSKEITAAQQEIVKLARQLESEGKMALRSDGDDEYVV